ncbi:MAG: DUF4129 domain-containing protein [Fimbriimonas sp.]|nr:DUF4129 domain-containing protein [Fimbriimonas sp.]
MRTDRATWTLVLLAAAALVSAGPYGDLKKQLDRQTGADGVIRTVSASDKINQQPDIKERLQAATDEDTDRDQIALDLRNMVSMGAMAEERSNTSIDASLAKQVKSNPLYRDQGVDKRENWFREAIERLKNLKWRPKEATKQDVPNIPLIGRLLVYALWGLLIGAVLLLLYYALRYVDWRSTLMRKSRTLLEEDEPERTLDEWLTVADAHASAGRYREAVRALYLACLLKFDEHDVARFDRGETNWEHLARIQSSPLRPTDLDFTEATKQFDRVWYGHIVRGAEDYELFKTWYGRVVSALEASR